MNKNDITVIILTKNEEKNIEYAIVSAKQISNRVIVVDSGSEDNTIKIAKENNAEVFVHEWSTHAKQFNWALDNCDIKTTWIFRLDADERISEELATEIQALEPTDDVDGYSMRWRIYFMNKWIKHGGTHKPYFLRLFRFKKGRVEDINMDEHILIQGKEKKLKNDFIHYDYKGLDAWLNKHIWYSNREISIYNDIQDNKQDFNTRQKKKRSFYYKLPLLFRAKFYYLYRYYFQLGFLDGKEGKIFIFLQAYWYRFLIDAKIYENNKANNEQFVKKRN